MSTAIRVELEPAYVLHGRAYRETSQILELFTPGYGRVGVVARGSRRPKSALRGLLNPFQPLRASWSGRGELATLTQAEMAGVTESLTGTTVMSGFYINELLLKLLTRNDPHPDLFAHYASLVDALSRGVAAEETLLRTFELRLLQEIGYAPNFEFEAGEAGAIQPEQNYLFTAEEGAVAVSGELNDQFTYSGATLLAIGRLDFSAGATRLAAKQLLRNLLNFHLGDRGLQTRRIAAAMKR